MLREGVGVVPGNAKMIGVGVDERMAGAELMVGGGTGEMAGGG